MKFHFRTPGPNYFCGIFGDGQATATSSPAGAQFVCEVMGAGGITVSRSFIVEGMKTAEKTLWPQRERRTSRSFSEHSARRLRSVTKSCESRSGAKKKRPASAVHSAICAR